MSTQKNDLKHLLFLFSLLFAITTITAQTETTTVAGMDSGKSVVTKQKVNAPLLKNVKDTFVVADSMQGVEGNTLDSVRKINAIMAAKGMNVQLDSFYIKLLNNPFLKSTKPPLYLIINERKIRSKDELFYLLSALLIVLAFVKLFFDRYFINVFKLLFQPSFRQKQTKEQLLQGNVPSFFMNFFFVLSGGAFIALLVEYYHLSEVGFRNLFFYSSASLFVLYSAKYIILQFAGWVFNVSDAIDNYVFVIYLINKIIGVVLMPFILVMAFSGKAIIDISVVVAIISIAVLFFYRYIISFTPVRREIKVSISHFFVYVMAVEFLPLLLICKMLIIYLNNSH